MLNKFEQKPDGVTTRVGGAPSEDLVTEGGKYQALVVATQALVVKQGAGRLCRVLISATGTAALSIFDASGQNGQTTGALIGYVPANAAVGTLYTFNMPANYGIYVPATANGPGCTLSFN